MDSGAMWFTLFLCFIFAFRVSQQREIFRTNHDEAAIVQGQENPLTNSDKAAIVNAHKVLRMSVSPVAANMREMVYSEELGKVALNYALKCSAAHSDKVKRSNAAPSFDKVGENIYATASTNKIVPDYTSYIRDSWGLSEKENYDYYINNWRSSGHYTQEIWASTTHVGCGTVSCPSEELFPGFVGYEAVLFICNYGPAGNDGGKPYLAGPACSACPADRPVCKANLCSAS